MNNEPLSRGTQTRKHPGGNADGEDYCDWKNWDSDAFGQTPIQTAKYFDAEMGELIKPGAGTKILEIGYGNGSFVGWCRARGNSVFGVESNALLVERARKIGVPAYLSVAEVKATVGPFDVVVAIDVLEHLTHEELQGLFSELRTVVQPDARFIARFPNGDSPLGLPYQNGDLTHRTAIGRLKLGQIAAATDWELVSVDGPVIASIGSSFPSRVKTRIGLSCRRLIESIASVLYFSGQRFHFAPNTVAVLRPRQKGQGKVR